MKRLLFQTFLFFFFFDLKFRLDRLNAHEDLNISLLWFWKNESAGSNSNYRAASWLLLPLLLCHPHDSLCLGHPESTTAYAELQRNHHKFLFRNVHSPLKSQIEEERWLADMHFNLWHQPTFILKCSVFPCTTFIVHCFCWLRIYQLLGKGHSVRPEGYTDKYFKELAFCHVIYFIRRSNNNF